MDISGARGVSLPELHLNCSVLSVSLKIVPVAVPSFQRFPQGTLECFGEKSLDYEELFLLFKLAFIYWLGPHCCENISLAAVCGLLIGVASLLVVPGLQDTQA